jgi:hypothetical protein
MSLNELVIFLFLFTIISLLINIAGSLSVIAKKSREIESHLFFIKHYSEWWKLSKEGE